MKSAYGTVPVFSIINALLNYYFWQMKGERPNRHVLWNLGSERV